MFLLTSIYSSYLFLFLRGYKDDFLQSCEVEPNSQSGIFIKAQSAGLRKDSKAQSAGPKQNGGQSAKRPFKGFSTAHGAKAQSAGSAIEAQKALAFHGRETDRAQSAGKEHWAHSGKALGSLNGDGNPGAARWAPYKRRAGRLIPYYGVGHQFLINWQLAGRWTL